MTLLVAIHGILTRQTDVSWPDRLDAWMSRRDPAVRVLKKEYAAGPFPRWNCWVKDPQLAHGLARELALFWPPPGVEAPQPNVWFVAHSNGAVIALLAARRLIASGHRIGGLILTGAACDADLARNGVFSWWQAGQLGAALAYASADDRVLPAYAGSSGSTAARLRDWLWARLSWPYGGLGRTGWLYRGRRVLTLETSVPAAPRRAAILTRWVRGGHSAYFAPENQQLTFEQIYQDIQTP